MRLVGIVVSSIIEKQFQETVLVGSTTPKFGDILTAAVGSISTPNHHIPTHPKFTKGSADFHYTWTNYSKLAL